MFATHCPSTEQLQQYAVGRLSDGTSDQIAEHLDGCVSCQAAIATLDDAEDTFVTALKRPVGEDPLIDESQCQTALARAAALSGSRRATRVPIDHTTQSRAGSTLGEYQLLEEIGRGGMGRVYRALQTKLDRVVALKVLPLHRTDDRRAAARFEREMKAIGQLDHPNIVHAYDAREIDDKPVLVMEYVEGRDLANVLHYLGRLTTADACELIRQAALGLQYAHEHGLVHRDVKPSNLMVTPQGNVKLLDLGLARFEQSPSPDEEMTGVGQPMGTADYMAPEQVSDSRGADIRADIYGLGCTLFKLLTGQAPFAGPADRGTFDKLTAHVSQPAPSIRDYLPTLPRELVELISQMLAKAPADRPATPAEVVAALAPFCSNSDLAGVESMAATAQRNNSFDGSEIRPPRYVAPPDKPPLSATQITRSGWIWGIVATVVLLAGAGGFALGVVITIKHNGKRTTVRVPDGSTVAIDQSARVNVQVPPSVEATSSASQIDFQTIQGVWRVVGRKGKASSQSGSLLRARRNINSDGTYKEDWKTSQIVFTDKMMRILGDYELPTAYEYQINPAESPKMIDAFVNGRELPGVYELNGDQLKICFQRASRNGPNDRPQAVWAGLNTNQEMLVLQRIGPFKHHPDERAILGAWVIRSAKLAYDHSSAPFAPIAAPTGTIAPGRNVVITPEEFIIKAAPTKELKAASAGGGSGMPEGTGVSMGGGPGALQPLMVDAQFNYAIDPARHWIGFSALSTAPCPGLYKLSKNQLVIRLGTTDRPSQVDVPRTDGDCLLTLTRPFDAPVPDVPPRANSALLMETAEAVFNKLDANHNGVLSTEEWLQIEKTNPQEFDLGESPDTNNDGHITLSELTAMAQYSRPSPTASAPGEPKKTIKQMLILVDSLGSVTIEFGLNSEHLGGTGVKTIEAIKKRIAEHSIESVTIKVGNNAPRNFVPALTQALKETTVTAYNVTGGPVSLAPVHLDFRIAATRDSEDLPGLSDEEVKLLQKMNGTGHDSEQGTAPDALASKYTWLEVEQDAAEEMRSSHSNMIQASLPLPHLLVSTDPDSTMLATDKGERAWKIVRAELVEDFAGHPAIALTFDEAGGRRLGELTATHHRRPLAVIINDKVVMAPRILSKITNRVQITGYFDKELARQLVDAFNASAPLK